MPKFLYILLLVNLTNACQNEHSGGTEAKGSGMDREQHAERQDIGVATSSEKPLQPALNERKPLAAEAPELGSVQLAASADSLANLGEAASPESGLRDKELKTPASIAQPAPDAAPSDATPTAATPTAATPRQVFTQWDALFADLDLFLKDAVSGGLVRYGDLAVAPVMLDDMTARISNADLDKASTLQNKAFKINAYNVLVMKQVVDHYPIPSPMDIAGFFDRQTYGVAGKKTTLNDLEAGLRSDPRIHFALVCGALGCPKILDGAFMPGKLDQQLDAVTRQALNDPTFIRYREGDQYAELSQIFNWYAQDFGGKDAILAYINEFRNQPIPEGTAITFYDYNWKLNKTP
ncbi:MAG: DUF547 domain-containing protein [Bacteroidetes bacterium]|nr:DUF547 domain-containing protein [Bacteroidota bacterium]